MNELERFGWHPGLSFPDLDAHPDWQPARVVAQHRELWRVVTAGGEVSARSSGRLRYEAEGSSALPAVGDWVLVESRPDMEHAVILDVELSPEYDDCRKLARRHGLPLRHVVERVRSEAQEAWSG